MTETAARTTAPATTTIGVAAVLAIATVAALIDLASKAIAARELADRDIALPGPIDLVLSHNTGTAFGLGNNLPAWLVILITAAVTVGLIAAVVTGRLARSVGVALIIGGATANLIDRAVGGSVTDMLHTGWWPTFNLADVWITAGVALLLVGAMRERSK